CSSLASSQAPDGGQPSPDSPAPAEAPFSWCNSDAAPAAAKNHSSSTSGAESRPPSCSVTELPTTPSVFAASMISWEPSSPVHFPPPPKKPPTPAPPTSSTTPPSPSSGNAPGTANAFPSSSKNSATTASDATSGPFGPRG